MMMAYGSCSCSYSSSCSNIIRLNSLIVLEVVVVEIIIIIITSLELTNI